MAYRKYNPNKVPRTPKPPPEPKPPRPTKEERLEAAVIEKEAELAKLPKAKRTGLPDMRRKKKLKLTKKNGRPKGRLSRKTYEKMGVPVPPPPPPKPNLDLISQGANRLTPELQKKFIEYVLMGLPPDSVCGLVGIHPLTLRAWMVKAMDPEEPDRKYSDFAIAIHHAEEIVEGRYWKHINNVGGVVGKAGEMSFTTQADARAALQLRFPNKYGNRAVTVNKDTGALEGPVGAPKPPATELPAEMTLDEIRETRDAANRILDRAIERKESPPEPLKKPAIGRRLES